MPPEQRQVWHKIRKNFLHFLRWVLLCDDYMQRVQGSGRKYLGQEGDGKEKARWMLTGCSRSVGSVLWDGGVEEKDCRIFIKIMISTSHIAAF